MSNKVKELIEKNKYVVVAVMGKTEIVAYKGDSAIAFDKAIHDNMYVNLRCFKDGKIVQKESVLFNG